MKRVSHVSFHLLAAACGLLACIPDVFESSGPFDNLAPVAIDGRPHTLHTEVSSLGYRREGEVLQITIHSTTARACYLLRRDQANPAAGVIVNGSKTGIAFLHRVTEGGELFLFVDAPVGTKATATVNFGPPDYEPPNGQTIVVEFEADFLVNGLSDPTTDNAGDRQLLMSIEPLVRDGVIHELNGLFANTGVEILAAGTERPAAHSSLLFTGARQTATGTEPDALPVAGCDQTVVFGELLPHGVNIDPGNHDPEDAAIVYVGSFRATGDCPDPGFVINSASNIINALSLAGAHEIGHLLGLNHTALDGLMAASPSFAFQRQLQFERGQIVVGYGDDLQIVTAVVQDPEVYLANIFDQRRK